MGEPVRVDRFCGIGVAGPHPPHDWERLNEVTMRPFRRGRVVFMCQRVPHGS